MKLELNIEKRETLIIVAVLLLISIGVGVYAGTYANPVNKVGHDADELTPGTIEGDLEITGNLRMASGSGVYLIDPPNGITNGGVVSIICNTDPSICIG